MLTMDELTQPQQPPQTSQQISADVSQLPPQYAMQMQPPTVLPVSPQMPPATPVSPMASAQQYQQLPPMPPMQPQQMMPPQPQTAPYPMGLPTDREPTYEELKQRVAELEAEQWDLMAISVEYKNCIKRYEQMMDKEHATIKKLHTSLEISRKKLSEVNIAHGKTLELCKNLLNDKIARERGESSAKVTDTG